MLEIRPAEAVIAACHAAAEVLDTLPPAFGLVLRVAPDEAWVVARRDRRAGLLRSVEAWLGSADPHGLVVDQTDGWSLYDVRGRRETIELFGRLSVSPAPADLPALVQGALAGVPGKVWFEADGACLMVPSPVGHHLLARVETVGSDLGLTLRDAEPFRFGGNERAQRRES